MGSSPLTRGKRRLREAEGFEARLIPAHAGKTLVRLTGDTHVRAHPRSRGENRQSQHARIGIHGSSPLTRGKRHPPRRGHERPGLIPAHAGKTPARGHQCSTRRAHPRSRGENPYAASNDQDPKGSSPLTRGKQCGLARPRDADGLIPAHAGKTPARGHQCSTRRAHPRSRGENPYAASNDQDPKGSSPLTRGKQCGLARPRDADGLIPAHAGKTRASPVSLYA